MKLTLSPCIGTHPFRPTELDGRRCWLGSEINGINLPTDVAFRSLPMLANTLRHRRPALNWVRETSRRLWTSYPLPSRWRGPDEVFEG
jgi:hypothetical protein